MWSFGQGLAPSAGPAGARPLVFNKKLDPSSPKLAAAAATGHRLKNAVLDVLRPTSAGVDTLFYRVILHDVTLRQYSTSWSPSSALPIEQIELGYSKIEWYYFSPGPNGTVILQSQAKLDVASNTLYP
jgi:type VI secretion system Hcp family effector